MAQQSTKRLVSSVFALLLLVAAGVVFFLFVQPLYGNILAVRGEELARRTFLDEQRQIVNQVKKIVAAYAEEEGLQQAISSALPLSPAVADALLQIQGIASGNNVSVRSYEIIVPAPAPARGARPASGAAAAGTSALGTQTVSPVNIRVELTGSYDDFKGFLRSIETNIRIFDVKNLAVQPTSRTTPNILSYTVNLTAYYQHSSS